MNKTNEHIKHYNNVSDDIRYISNSVIRLKILKTLYDGSENMKELTQMTNLSYSSVSTILHGLELKNLIYRKSNKYYLVNSLRLQMKNIIHLAKIINLLEEIYNIIEGHIIDTLPKDSIRELYLLNESELLESDGVNTDMINNFIEENLKKADNARCILPIYYEGFNKRLNELVENDKYVEIKVSKKIENIYEKKSKVKYLSSFEGKNNFLLILTNQIMILGFFRKGSIFDKNRILISTDKDALKWANNLFRYFKMENK